MSDHDIEKGGHLSVEEFLTRETERLIADLQRHTEGMCTEVMEEFERGKAELLAQAQDDG
jgi:hypothetical protein